MNYQNYQNLMLLTSSNTKPTKRCLYSCLQIPPKENWFQSVRRVYATAINFPCLSVTKLSNYQNVGYQIGYQIAELPNCWLPKCRVTKLSVTKLLYLITYGFRDLTISSINWVSNNVN